MRQLPKGCPSLWIVDTQLHLLFNDTCHEGTNEMSYNIEEDTTSSDSNMLISDNEYDDDKDDNNKDNDYEDNYNESNNVNTDVAFCGQRGGPLLHQ